VTKKKKIIKESFTLTFKLRGHIAASE